jgi:hypothetical protein
MSSNGPEPKDVTQNEQRELKRVFDFLQDFAAKQKYRQHLQPKLDRKAKILAFKKNPEAVKIVDETGAELPLGVIEAELLRLETEIADLQRHIDAYDARLDAEKKIHPKDLQQALAFLGKHTEKVRKGLAGEMGRADASVRRNAGLTRVTGAARPGRRGSKGGRGGGRCCRCWPIWLLTFTLVFRRLFFCRRRLRT